MNGRVHVVLPDAVDVSAMATARPALAEALGAYRPGNDAGLMCLGDTLSGADLFHEPFLVQDIDGVLIRLIERRVVGQDWARNCLRMRTGRNSALSTGWRRI